MLGLIFMLLLFLVTMGWSAAAQSSGPKCDLHQWIEYDGNLRCKTCKKYPSVD
jgi:hypothetical protein